MPVELGEREYVELWTSPREDRPRGRVRVLALQLAAVLTAGFAMLSPYTLGLGLVIVAGVIASAFAPSISETVLRSRYRRAVHLHGPLRVTVDGDGIEAAGDDFSGRWGWRLVDRWHRRGGWILIRPSGGDWLPLPADELRRHAVLGRVLGALGGEGAAV